MDFREHRVVDLAANVRSRSLSAREVVAASLDRIQELDGELGAFVQVDAEQAMADADDIDNRLVAGDSVGPLAGVPVAVKDLEDAGGLPTRYGSQLSSADPAAGDSVLVARLRAAGCVIVGKTATPEYGHKGTTESKISGITRNPHNPDRSPGGSSGGSAAALAAGMVPLATGSDGGGSIRIPSALCGLSGIKTTNGRVANGGPEAPGHPLFAVKGPMTLKIADAAFALDVCVGPHPTDVYSLPRSGSPWFDATSTARLPVRVAWSPTMGFANVDDEMAAVCAAAVGRLAEAGVDVVEIASVWSEDPVVPWFTLWAAAAAKKFGHLVGTSEFDKLDESYQWQVQFGLDLSAVDVMKAMDHIHVMNLELDAAFEQAPLLVTPMVAGQTPLVGHNGTINGEEVVGWVGFSYGFNMTRNPAGTVNAGTTSDGMPVGLQIVGRQLDDVGVLQAMKAMEDLFGVMV